MTTIKTFKYRIYPDKNTEKKLSDTLWLCSIIYNRCIDQRMTAWKEEQKSVSFYDQSKELPGWKREDPRFAGVYSSVLVDTVRRVDKAFQAFFRRCKAGETPGHPRFQSARFYDSLCYPAPSVGYRVAWNGDSRCGRLSLSSVGDVKIRMDRPLPADVRTLTIKREAGRWYAFFVVRMEVDMAPAVKPAVGIDLGIEHLVTTSDGEHIGNPKLLRTAERKLKTASRMVSRRKKGSHRRWKAKRLLGRFHATVRDARQDLAHKVAFDLAGRYRVIVAEDLKVTNMVRNRHLAKSISDAGWSILTRLLEEKTAVRGGRLVKVNPAYTSQLCSDCGETVSKKLSERRHRCVCGCDLQRDVNAAKNILARGMEMMSK